MPQPPRPANASLSPLRLTSSTKSLGASPSFYLSQQNTLTRTGLASLPRLINRGNGFRKQKIIDNLSTATGLDEWINYSDLYRTSSATEVQTLKEGIRVRRLGHFEPFSKLGSSDPFPDRNSGQAYDDSSLPMHLTGLSCSLLLYT